MITVVIVRPSLVAQAIMFCCCGQPGDRNQWRDVEAVEIVVVDDVVGNHEVFLVGDRHKDASGRRDSSKRGVEMMSLVRRVLSSNRLMLLTEGRDLVSINRRVTFKHQ